MAATYKCDPYGRTLSSSGSLASANIYRFSSKEIHPNSGFYYYGFRFYDPNTQRWLNRDPIGEAGSFNLYGFVRNGPVGHLDPLGLEIKVEGPKDFRRKVKECVKALRRSKCGKKLWDDARKSKYVEIIIEPAPDAKGPYAATSPCRIALDARDPIFVGTNAPIREFPSELPPYDPGKRESVAKACACVLGHELGHAFLDLEDAPDGRNVEDCENPIRCELGLPPRRSYHGTALTR